MRFKDSLQTLTRRYVVSAHLLKRIQSEKNGMLIEMNNFWYKFHEYSNFGVFFFCFVSNSFATMMLPNWCYRRYLLLLWITSVFLKKKQGKVFSVFKFGWFRTIRDAIRMKYMQQILFTVMLNGKQASFFPFCELCIASASDWLHLIVVCNSWYADGGGGANNQQTTNITAFSNLFPTFYNLLIKLFLVILYAHLNNSNVCQIFSCKLMKLQTKEIEFVE